MSTTTTAAEAFFESRLGADTAGFPVPTVPAANAGETLDVLVPGGFHSERIHTAIDGSYIIWSLNAPANDTMGDHGFRIMSNLLFVVRVIGAVSDFGDLQPAASRMDAVLHMAPPQTIILDNQTYTIQSCLCERPYSLVERLVDIERRHLGGYYRVLVSPFGY